MKFVIYKVAIPLVFLFDGHSLAESMDIEELWTTCTKIKKGIDAGQSIIRSLKDYIAEVPVLKEAFRIIDEDKYRLLVSFFGCRFVFRIELEWKGAMPTPKVTAYTQSYGEDRTETPLKINYTFDYSGAISGEKGPIPLSEFPRRFLADVFTKATAAGILLRP